MSHPRRPNAAQASSKESSPKKRPSKASREIEFDSSTSAAAYEDSLEDPDSLDFEEERPRGKKRKLVLGLVLLLPIFLMLITFMELLFNQTVDKKLWVTPQVWFFSSGCLFWFLLGWLGLQPSYLYVFAHEMTHVLSSRFSGGRIIDMKISESGGYIDTDKTSTFITLSPYFIPLYSLLVVCLYGVVSLFFNLEADRYWLWSSDYMVFQWGWVFFFLIGLTWCFHLTYTIKALAAEQSDLTYNGEFFSMILIFFVNLVVLGTFFVIVSPSLSWFEVFHTMKQFALRFVA